MKKLLYGKEFEIIDMSEKGNSDLIFDLISAIEYMFLAIKNGKIILGGDIYVKKQSGFEHSYDNWYSQSKDPQETLTCALNY